MGTLLLLIVAIICTLIALGLTLILRLNSFNPWFNRKQCLKWVLLLISLKSALSGISGVWYIDSHVTSEQFRHSWSSYVAWISVGLLILVNIPVVYLLRLKPPTSGSIKLDDGVGIERLEKEFIFP